MLLSLIDSAALGRLEYTTMSQQALMECLIASFTSESCKPFQDENGNFTDIAEWPGIELNSAGNVTHMNWKNKGGSIDFQWLPQHVQVIELRRSKDLSGSIDFGLLPRPLERLTITDTSITGEMFFETLPPQIAKLDLRNNAFALHFELSKAPETLRTLEIQSEKGLDFDLQTFSRNLHVILICSCHVQGSLSFVNSPPELRRLHLSTNNLSGTLSLTGAAQTLEEAILYSNTFHGALNLSDLPETLSTINIAKNKFTELVIEGTLSDAVRILHISTCEFRGSNNFLNFGALAEHINIAENGFSGSVRLEHMEGLTACKAERNFLEGSLNLRNLPPLLLFLDLSDNQLSGSLDLTALPESLQHIHLHNNNFSGSVDVDHLPATLWAVSLNDNQLSGTLRLTSATYSYLGINLAENAIEAVVIPVSSIPLPCVDMRGNPVDNAVDARGKEVKATRITLG